MTRVRWAAAATAAILLGAACGDEDDGPLSATEDAMAELQAGTLELELSASAGEGDDRTGPVGFRLEGPFSFAGDTELAVFDLEYTRLLGDDERTTAVTSTGEEAFVTVDGAAYRVPADDARALRLGDDEEGFGDLGISGWATDVEVTDGDEVDGRPTERITGEVDAADLLSDLARLAGSLSGDEELQPLDDDTGDRLQELVRNSSIEVVTDAEDHRLHSLVAVIDFGNAVPEELRASLGAYASSRIEVHLALVPGSDDLEVEAPADFEEL